MGQQDCQEHDKQPKGNVGCVHEIDLLVECRTQKGEGQAITL